MLELNKIYNLDYIEGTKQLEDNSVDFILIDPPYKIGYGNLEWDNKNDFSDFTTKWVKEVVRLLKPTGSMWCFMAKDNLFTHKYCEKGLVNILQEYGEVNLDNWCVWMRQKGRGSSKHLKSQREEIIHFTKSKNYTWNNLKMLREVVTPYVRDGRPRGWFLDENGMRKRWTGLGNVFVYSAPQWNGIVEKQWHESQKPILLLERLIRLSSNENDIVLDLFSGSGSVAIASKLSKRNFIAFEKDKEYYDKSIERLNNFNFLNYTGYNDKTDKEIEEYMNKLNNKKIIDSKFV